MKDLSLSSFGINREGEDTIYALWPKKTVLEENDG